jgi:hypothetical protein
LKTAIGEQLFGRWKERSSVPEKVNAVTGSPAGRHDLMPYTGAGLKSRGSGQGEEIEKWATVGSAQ